MKNCIIVCEYNPFHSGHKYQLDCAKELGASNIICIMSGNFVQSAQPSICKKSLRTKCALMGGADAVIELPTIYATSSAGYFADGAIKCASGIKNLSHIVMGATVNYDTIMKIADVKIKYKQEYESQLLKYLKNGKSYNIASITALNDIFNKKYCDATISEVMSEPNNVLCVEYICSIDKYASQVQPQIIERKGALHGSHILNAEHISATAIRNNLMNDNANIVERYIPYHFDDILLQSQKFQKAVNIYHDIAVFTIKNSSIEQLKLLRNCSNGMEYLLKKISYLSNYDEYINATACKKYGKKRISRLLLDCILNIKQELLFHPFCTRLLGCKQGFNFSILPNHVKANNRDLQEAAKNNSKISDVLQIDIAATNLYNTIFNIEGGYFNYSLIKEV